MKGVSRERCRATQASFEVLRNIMWKSTGVLRRIIVSNYDSDSLTLSCVCPQGGLFSVEDFVWWVSEGHQNQKEEAVPLLACGL